MTTVCVVPTNRSERCQQFLRDWEGAADWDELIIVEDGLRQTFECGATEHHSWASIDETLGDDAWIISRQIAAIRCFGFLRAWQRGADYILTLDDDTEPYTPEPIIGAHLRALCGHERWIGFLPDLRTRGLPYRDRGQLSTVVVNVGTWAGEPDLDASQQLVAPVHDYVPQEFSRIVPAGQYVPVSTMNLFFTRWALPLFYMPLCGKGELYNRFEDIWAGIIAKKILDHLSYHIAIGMPAVRHKRASDPFRNLAREALAVGINEWFWRVIDEVELTGITPLECMEEIGEALRELPARDGVQAMEYLGKMGRALAVWCELLTQPAEVLSRIAQSLPPNARPASDHL